MDPFVDSVITEEYFIQRPHYNFFNKLFYDYGLKNIIPFSESRTYNPLEPQRSSHWYGRSPHVNWVDGIIDYTYNKYNINSIGHFHMFENRKNKPQKSHSGGDRSYFLPSEPVFSPVPMPKGCFKEIKTYKNCKEDSENLRQYFNGSDMKKLKEEYSKISDNIANSIKEYLSEDNKNRNYLFEDLKNGKKNLKDILELLPSKNDIAQKLKDFEDKYGYKMSSLVTKFNHTKNEKSVINIVMNNNTLSNKLNNSCTTEKINIVEVCPKWVLEALREKKKAILKCTVIDNRTYRNAMKVEDYNKNRSLKDIKDKYAHLRSVRAETYWADDRYNPTIYPSPDQNTNIVLGDETKYNDVIGGNNIELTIDERKKYSEKLNY